MPNHAFENGRSQASLRSLACAVQRGRWSPLFVLKRLDGMQPRRLACRVEAEGHANAGREQERRERMQRRDRRGPAGEQQDVSPRYLFRTPRRCFMTASWDDHQKAHQACRAQDRLWGRRFFR